jgi:hypothetical protein
MMEIQMVWAWLQLRRHDVVQSARAEPDRGSDIVTTAIIIGLMAAAAIVIVAILVSKATDAANNVKTQ